MNRPSRIALLALLLLGGPLAAQQPPGTTRTPAGIEFDFQNADLQSVLSALAEVAGLNVVLSNLPSSRVTLRTSRPIAPGEVRAYLESVVRSNGLEISEQDGLLHIQATARAAPAPDFLGGAPGGRSLQGGARLCIEPLRFAEAALMAQTLSALFGTAPAAASGPEAPESLSEQLQEQRIAPYVPGAPAAAPPPGAARRGVAAGLQGEVQIVPDARTNALLIRASASDCAVLHTAVQQLDQRPLQVLIEVLIVEVRRDRQLGLGIDVDVPNQRIGDSDTRIGGELIGSAAGDLTLRVLGIGGADVDVIIRALATNAKVNILSRPTILAENNREARILVGTQRPFIQVFRALPTDAAVRDQVVQYRDVGTELTIQPVISPEGYVSLAVLQEVSTATAETQFGAPVISTREARTQLLARDGQTVVLGGLIDQSRELTTSGIPFLQDIPLLGGLFRSTSYRRNHTELFLFLTPHVLRDDADLERVTRQIQQRRAIRSDVRRAPLLVAPDTATPTTTPPRTPTRTPAQTPAQLPPPEGY